MSFREDPLEDFAPDEAEELWGGGPTELGSAKPTHIPFYKCTYYADRLALGHAGYELEKFSESPELADRKKIQGVEGVWELRVHRTGSRVYFLTERKGVVVVLLVGKKEDQERDITRVRALRDREIQRVKTVFEPVSAEQMSL